MTVLMYWRSRSPRSAKTSSWIASSSLPSFSISCSLKRLSGVCLDFFTALVMGRSFRSQLEFDVTFGGVDADSDVLSGRLGHVARPQVAQLAGLQRPNTRMADPDTTTVGE